MSFFNYFFNVSDVREEVAVCCPFPHYTANNGVAYYENNPSAHVNTIEGLFHCKACDQGHSEQSFIRAILGCSPANALRLAQVFNNDEDYLTWDSEFTLTEDTKNVLNTLGVADETIDELCIKTLAFGEQTCIAFPVFMYDKLIDIRRYNPNSKPKVVSRSGAVSGLIIPFDLWRTTPLNRVTLICAGEKDMAVARSHGFNAITLTGGEQVNPAILNQFYDRNVVIVYDNDEAGKQGAIKLATTLQPYVKSIKNCTEFHEVCCNDKEDITDFFVKYNKTKQDLVKYLKQTPEFEIPIGDTANYPMLSLHEATQPKYIGHMLRSNIQVVATSESSFIIPSVIIGEKRKEPVNSTSDKMYKGEIREWNLSENTVQDILHLMDNNFKESDLNKNYRNLLHILQKETWVYIRKPIQESVYKCYVTDMFETTTANVMPMEFTAYSVGMKLESGKKYFVTYKLVPHPYHGQQLVMLITKAQQASDSVSNFKITDEVKQHLDIFRNLTGTVEERITECAERFKSILGYNGNNLLIQTMDLAYHTVLEFNFGTFNNIRGYLDTIIIGESRMGKSSTADAMRQIYGLGTVVSLAGNAATIPGLIGGSNKVGNSYQTRAGIIPQNHKGMLIFEEFGKSNGNIIKELTDIRSSNEVRITRVSGTLTLPAILRLVFLTNIKSSEGNIKPIAAYPNGLAILTELIGAAEDIARYDIALILSDRGNAIVDPYWHPQAAFDVTTYQTRVRWVWSRKSEDIIISEAVGRYIITCANILNEAYECHIKIFGTEAWKKLTRLAIAIAGYLVSTDETYEKIVVQQEHVDYAISYFKKIYDNPVFKLKEYVEHERKYSSVDENGLALLQDLYIKCPALLLHLEQVAASTKNTLQAATGLTNEGYNAIMNRLVAGMFVTFNKYEIVPTERFRLGIAQINRNVHATRVGEIE